MSNINYKSILQEMGYRVTQDANVLRFKASYRGGSNPMSISMFSDTGVWVDYGVGDDQFNPFIRMVELSIGKNSKIYQQLKDEVPSVVDDKERLYKPSKSEDLFQQEKKFPKDSLELLLPHHKYFEERGVNTHILKMYKGGLSMSANSMSNRYTFPIFNEAQDIIGFSGRKLNNNNPNTPKWKHDGGKKNFIYPAFTPSVGSDTVFPFLDAIKEKGEVIIVESIGDSMALSQRGYLNNIVSFGVAVSPKVISFLSRFCDLKIFICTNNDLNSDKNNGLIGGLKATLCLLESFDYENIKICLPTKNDFGDMDNEDFLEWEEKKKKVSLSDQKPLIIKQSKIFISKKLIPKKYTKLIEKIEKL